MSAGAIVPSYVGRFAPAPSGPLHFGSLVTALASWLQARRAGGRWLLRIEDLDSQREQPGAADSIMRVLEKLGLVWDGAVEYQSWRAADHRAALARLAERAHIYPCACTRREVGAGRAYAGSCRAGLPAGRAPRSLRLDVRGARIALEDALQGYLEQDLEREVGDFIIGRPDGSAAYQLAVVADDAAQGVTEVIRGADLLSSTPRQVHLQRLLGLPTPSYAHIPLAIDAEGRKLSKQNHAPAIEETAPSLALVWALRFLGQSPDPSLRRAAPAEILAWACAHWDLGLVPRLGAKAAGTPTDIT